MGVRSGQSITTEFVTSSFSTGAAADADSTPSGVLYLNGTANGATVTVTNIATGLYKAAVTLPTLAVNDVVGLVMSATVGGEAGKGRVWEGIKDVFAGAIPDVIAGAAGGLQICGSNAATTYATFTVTGAVAFQSTWTVTGAVVFTSTFSINGTSNVSQTGDSYARVGAPAGASVSADIAAVNAKTTNLPSDPADESLIIAATDAIMSRIGAPAGVSVSADVAAVKVDTAAVKLKTDHLTFTVSNVLDANVQYVNDVQVDGVGTTLDPWGPV